MLKQTKKQIANSKGQGLVEFALILPLLLLLIWGVIESARYLFIYISVTNASREAARYGASVGPGEVDPNSPRFADCAGIRSTAQRIGTIAGVNPTDVFIEYDGGSGNPGNPTPTPYSDCENVETSDVDLGDRIVVEVNVPYAPLVPLVPYAPANVSSISAKIIVKDILIATLPPAPTVPPTPTPIQSPTPTDTPTEDPNPTETPTVTPTPDCNLIQAVPGPSGASFIVTGGDDLQFTVVNNNPAPVTLTNTNLVWFDAYDPDMFVDIFQFAGNDYWPGDDLESPTNVTSNVEFPGSSTAVWLLDFDGYGALYEVTHTIGPFSIDLVFNNGFCTVSEEIPVVESWIHKPNGGDTISNINQTAFEARAHEGTGGPNGSGIEEVHIVLLDPSDNVVANWVDTSAPYCVWGTESPCPQMSQGLWDSLPNGNYRLLAWGQSSATNSWSQPAEVVFSLQRTLPTATPTGTSTATATRTPTPTNTGTVCPVPVCTVTPTPTQTLTPTPTNTSTNTPSPTVTSTITQTPTPLPTSTPVPTSTPICPIYASPFTIVNNKLTFQITNNSGVDYIISTVYISWPDTATQNLVGIDLAGNTFWSGIQATSPFSGNTSDWIGTEADRTIPPYSSRSITFTFSENLPAFSYFIQLSFVNGCSLAISN